jgi:hypothetical protein
MGRGFQKGPDIMLKDHFRAGRFRSSPSAWSPGSLRMKKQQKEKLGVDCNEAMEQAEECGLQ